MLTLKRFQDEVGRWGDVTFQHQTLTTIMRHLHRESSELDIAIERLRQGLRVLPVEAAGDMYLSSVKEECADMLILLLGLAHKGGFDLLEAAEAKHATNLTRQWGAPDAHGVCEHVR